MKPAGRDFFLAKSENDVYSFWRACFRVFCLLGSLEKSLRTPICTALQAGGIAMVEGYCVKCKAKAQMKDPKQTKLDNGRDCVKGVCPKCGTKMCRMGKM